MVETTQPTIESATEIVATETTLLRREQQALERFLGRLSDLQAADPAAVEAPAHGQTLCATGRVAPRLEAVRRAYRETVMAVPHYEREYGDTLERSMAAEFGEALAGHVTNGQALTPDLYDALRDAAAQSRRDRGEFLGVLRRERESLGQTATGLNEVEARAVELDEHIAAAVTSADLAGVDDELAALESRCADLATRRQETIHDRSVAQLAGVEGTSLPRYLYAELETVTPALSDATDCLELIRCKRARCLH